MRLCIDTPPNPLVLFAWIYQFSGYPAGPAIELSEYRRGCSSTEAEKSSGLVPGFAKFGMGLVFLVLFQVLGAQIPVGSASDWNCTYMSGCVPVKESLERAGILSLPGGSVLSPEFLEYSFLIRFVYILAVGYIIRFRYYFAWLTAEAAFNVAGFGYSPGSSHSAFFGLWKEWNGMANIDIFRLETSLNMSAMMKNWNLKTQRWLSSYVYLRVKGSKSTRTFVTYTSSALWHGLYPGYYVLSRGSKHPNFPREILLPIFGKQSLDLVRHVCCHGLRGPRAAVLDRRAFLQRPSGSLFLPRADDCKSSSSCSLHRRFKAKSQG